MRFWSQNCSQEYFVTGARKIPMGVTFFQPDLRFHSLSSGCLGCSHRFDCGAKRLEARISHGIFLWNAWGRKLTAIKAIFLYFTGFLSETEFLSSPGESTAFFSYEVCVPQESVVRPCCSKAMESSKFIMRRGHGSSSPFTWSQGLLQCMPPRYRTLGITRWYDTSKSYCLRPARWKYGTYIVMTTVEC
jgi:hypothetical protein